MADSKETKSLMRNLGEFVGHLVRAVKADTGSKRVVVRKSAEAEDRGGVTLRRTTIEEIEFQDRNP